MMQANGSTKDSWRLLLRGIVAVLFGVLAFAMPGAAGLTLALLFGLFLLADGIIEIGYAFSSKKWWNLVPGFLGIAGGVFSTFYPQIAEFALLLIVAAWAIIRGALDIVDGVQLRNEISAESMMVLAGFLSVVAGVALVVFPATGALAVVWMIGAYALVFGVVTIVAAFQGHGRTSRIGQISS